MANKHRGEVTLNLCGKEFTLRPTFESLVEFEEKSGLTAYEAMRDCMANQRAPLKAIAAAFWAGIRGGWSPGVSNPPTFSEIGSLVFSHGIKNCLEPYLTFLSNAITSEEEINSMKEKAAAGKEQSG